MAIELKTGMRLATPLTIRVCKYQPLPNSAYAPGDTQEFVHDGLHFAYSPRTGRFFSLHEEFSLADAQGDPAFGGWILHDQLGGQAKPGAPLLRLYGENVPEFPKPRQTQTTRLIGQHFLNGGEPLPDNAQVRHRTNQPDYPSNNRLPNLQLLIPRKRAK